jgi:hypothetical protein
MVNLTDFALTAAQKIRRNYDPARCRLRYSSSAVAHLAVKVRDAVGLLRRTAGARGRALGRREGRTLASRSIQGQAPRPGRR